MGHSPGVTILNSPGTGAAEAPGRSALRFWAWLGLGVVLALLAAQGLCREAVRGLGDYPRNPNFRRGWPEYLAAVPPRQPGEWRVLVIANSQGYAPEIDPRKAYPRLLEQQLRRQGVPARVVNGSVPAGRYFDLLLLAAAARELEVDQILLVVSTGLFGDQSVPRPGREGWASDLHHLLGDGEFRGRLPERQVGLRLEPETEREIALARVLPAWRWRTYPAARLARDPFWARLLPRERGGDGVRGGLPMGGDSPFQQEALEEMARVLKASCPEVVVVRMPLHSARRRMGGLSMNLFAAQCRQLGLEFWDAENLVPDREFIGHSHMKAAGHRRMAQWLAGHFQ